MEKAERVRATVVGSRRVDGVSPGGTVELDPSEVNVAALVEAGHIELDAVKPRRQKIERIEREEP